ncbi:MAG: PorV/PorQ family protein [Saprospiraceae bacterium]|nr:PorV/PorQ family protein [Saprospiraceae bacterium]
MQIRIVIILALILGLSAEQLQAGNPDRQGEAGGYELLLSPWARSSGFHTLNTSLVGGVEAMRLNVAGLARINKSELVISHMILFDGTGMGMNSVGLATRVGESGVLGITLNSLDFGDIEVTTTDVPEGTGATFSPNFFHIGIAYAKTFENKVSVGFLLRGVSESTADLNAFGFAIDAGVQYVTGPQDNFKFGISLRNVGSPMKFGGEGLSFQTPRPGAGNTQYDITVEQRAAKFELPSVLNIGVSYDFIIGTRHRLTALGNFTANSFSRDQVGGGLEYAFNEMFMVRAGYRYDLGTVLDGADNVYTGVSAGVTIEVPTKKGATSRFGVDYAYRATSPFDGTHNISIRYKI